MSDKCEPWLPWQPLTAKPCLSYSQCSYIYIIPREKWGRWWSLDHPDPSALENERDKEYDSLFYHLHSTKIAFNGLLLSFLAVAILLPRKQNHCASPSSFFSPRWNSVSITKDFYKLICSARFPGLKILGRVLPGTLLEFPSSCHSRPSPQLNWGGAAVRRLSFPARAESFSM